MWHCGTLCSVNNQWMLALQHNELPSILLILPGKADILQHYAKHMYPVQQVIQHYVFHLFSSSTCSRDPELYLLASNCCLVVRMAFARKQCRISGGSHLFRQQSLQTGPLEMSLTLTGEKQWKFCELNYSVIFLGLGKCFRVEVTSQILDELVYS